MDFFNSPKRLVPGIRSRRIRTFHLSPMSIRVVSTGQEGKSLAGVTCHLTDDVRLYTETPVEANADGSVDLVLRPCSFAYLEL